MTILRACVTCGRPSAESHCPEHKPKPWATSRRRERMGLSGGAWETLRRKVLARDMRCCYLCDQLGADEVDQLLDVAEGGTNDLSNLASCHAACHVRKHREPEWARERVEMALRVLCSDPSLPHRLTVENEKDRGDEDKHDLVNGARDGKEANSRDPAQGLGDSLIPCQGPHGPNGSEAERPSRPHGSSLGAGQ